MPRRSRRDSDEHGEGIPDGRENVNSRGAIAFQATVDARQLKVFQITNRDWYT
jgi:hypothetical protein